MTGTKKGPEGGSGPKGTNIRLLEAATHYAKAGIKVLPLKGKEPVGYLAPKGLHNATTDLNIIKSWWEREPEANIGLVPPDRWGVVDIDPRNGGLETIKTLVNGHKIGSLVAKTGGGGQHVWLKDLPASIRGTLGKGVDVKKSGKGYVVAPPSIHPDTGVEYEWKTEFDLDRVVAWPTWLVPPKAYEAARSGGSRLTKGQIKTLLKRIPADDYENWITVGMALKDGYGDKALGVWTRWSRSAPNASSEEECRKKWASFKGEGVSVGSLVALAGMKHPPPPTPEEEFKVEKSEALKTWALSAVIPKEIPWAWPGYLAFGSVHCIAGEPGAGKSSFVAGLVSRITNGDTWPDGENVVHGGSGVLLVNGEEDLRATIVPRLANCGARLDRVLVAREDQTPFSLQDDIDRVEALLDEHPQVRFVIVDPIGSYMHGVKQKEMDSWKDDHVRRVLHPWANMAQRRNICFIFVAHFGKAKAAKAMHRVMGSQAFIAVTRLAFVCTGARNYADDEDARAFGSIKQNLGRARPPLLYYIKPVGDDYDAPPTIEFSGQIQGMSSIEDLMDYEAEIRKREDNPEGLPARIVEYVQANPGHSMGAVADAIGIDKRSEGYRRAVHHLIDLGEIEHHRSRGPAKCLYLTGYLDVIE